MLFNDTKSFYILDDEDNIILLKSSTYTKDTNKSKNLDMQWANSDTVELVATTFFNSLKNNKYIQIPNKGEYVKVSMNDNLIETLLYGTFDPTFRDDITKIFIYMKNPGYFDIQEKLFTDVFQFNGNKRKPLIDFMELFIKFFKHLSNDLKNKAYIKARNYFIGKPMFKEIKSDFTNYSDGYKEFILYTISEYISYSSYYGRYSELQHIIDEIVFNDFNKHKKIYFKIISKFSPPTYSINSIDFYNLTKLTDIELIELSEAYNTVNIKLEILKRKIKISGTLQLNNYQTDSIENMLFSFIEWPKAYETAIIEILSTFTCERTLMINYKKISRLVERYETSKSFAMDYFNYNKAEIINVTIDKNTHGTYSDKYIAAFYIKQSTSLNYTNTFENDEHRLKYAKAANRSGDFALMVSMIFRTTSRDNFSDKIMKSIINKGVDSFIGSTDTYSLRTRLVRTFATLVHEKQRPRDCKSEIDKKYIRYFIEKLSDSKLRGSLLAKIFSMPKLLTYNYNVINNTKSDKFFGYSYSDFMNIIEDIDYRDDLSSAILLLVLTK